ncbi:GAF domain-containing protein [Granulicella arctica]|uniref:Signal transduction protein with GAF and PtsI domain n=1 Tax=Granulicella arctica TaxID=940613 RepID=A0A7Y9TUC0_9BACT|nr:signal transduction protein with GAF and PtsI domain [Granulicella arctica]
MTTQTSKDMDFLHAIGSRLATVDELHDVLRQIVDFVSSVLRCDSCFVYILQGKRLVLCASKNPHADIVDELGIELGEGLTGWVAEHLEPVAIPSKALHDPRFKLFQSLPEDRFEAFLSVPILCRGKLVGVINVQHKQPYNYSTEEVRLISTIGFLVGAEIERARLDTENTKLAAQLQLNNILDRATKILQKDLNVNEQYAYRMIQQESRDRRTPMKEIAAAVVLSDDLRRKRA